MMEGMEEGSHTITKEWTRKAQREEQGEQKEKEKRIRKGA
jgi:hypothetical protein